MRKTLLILLSFVVMGASSPLFGQSYIVDSIRYAPIQGGGNWSWYEVRGPVSNDISGHVTIPFRIRGADTILRIAEEAFWGCANITSVTLPSLIYEIADFAFHGCTSLTSINIPSNVIRLGTYAFEGCSSLTSISIPLGVEGILSGVFKGCSSLTSISLHDTITFINSGAFEGCTSLTDFVIPRRTRSIGSRAFAGCTNLSSVFFHDSVSSINDYAFAGCSRLSPFLVPDHVNYIGDHALDGIRHVFYSGPYENYVGDGATLFYRVHEDGLYYADSAKTVLLGADAWVTNLVIPSHVRRVAKNAFQGSTTLTTLFVPSTVDTIEVGAFAAPSLTTLYWNAINPTIINYHSSYGMPDIPYRTSAYWVFRISTYDTSAPCANITNLTIGSSVANIPEGFMRDMQTLTSVTIPPTVDSIGEYAFYNTGISSLTIPDGVQHIGQLAFATPTLTDVSWNASSCRNATQVNGSALYTPFAASSSIINSPISSLTIGDAVATVPDYFMYGITSLTTLVLPASLDTIGYRAFYDTRLSAINLPEHLKYIGAEAFYNATFSSLTIPTGVEFIGNAAFACPNLSTLYYNATRLTIGRMGSYIGGEGRLFYKSVRRLDPETYTYVIDTVRANLTSVIIGNSVSSIPDNFMREMISLTSVSIPASVDTIGKMAFQGSGLTSVTIPEGVKYIDQYAFDCPNLTSLTYNAERCQFPYYGVFRGSVSSLTIGNTVAAIPSYFMAYMTSLTSITIPASVKEIGGDAFRGTSLSSVTIPSTVDTISHAFQYIPTLETIYYNAPDAFTGRYHGSGPFSFAGCSGSEETVCSGAPITLIIGDNVRKLPTGIFAQLLIPNVVLPDSLQRIGDGAFYRNTTLTSITIPNTVYSIGRHAFGDCENLQTVTIGDVIGDDYSSIGFVDISDYAFYNAPIRNLTIGNYVNQIGNYAFNAMTEPDTFLIKCPSDPPSITINTFQNLNINASIIVPCGLRQYYQSADFWGVFTNLDENPACYTLITVGSNDLNKGTVAGGGRYSQGSVATLSALAKKDFAFAGWADGNNDNPRLVLVSGDASYTANFSSMTGGVVHDTTVVTLRDTVTVSVHDTTVVTLTDTLFVRDTLFVGDGDTLIVYRDIHDTIYITDTVYITNTVHDTVYITDTVYVGVDDVQTVNYMLYQQGGQIVVEGAEGSPVTVYDAVGRLLVTRRDTYGPVRFDAPAAGTYLVRVGSAAARRIVVVR